MSERTIDSEAAMLDLGAELARLIPPGCMIYLKGDLGAGKTTFVRGMLRALGVHGPVKSPTYTIVEPYLLAGRPIYHVDLYRINDPQELYYLGVREWLTAETICLVEWPELGGQVLPPADIVIQIDYHDAARKITFTALTAKAQRIVAALVVS